MQTARRGLLQILNVCVAIERRTNVRPSSCARASRPSEWNLKNLFTGWKDVDLTELGVAEARAAGKKLKARGLKFDVAYTSVLKRAIRTLDLIFEEMGETLPIVRANIRH